MSNLHQMDVIRISFEDGRKPMIAVAAHKCSRGRMKPNLACGQTNGIDLALGETGGLIYS